MNKTDKDLLEFLELCANKELKDVAAMLGISYDAVKQRLQRGRDKIVDYQTFLNRVRGLQKRNPRFRKLTTKGSLPEETDESEIEDWER